MKPILFIIIAICQISLTAQTTISGKVTDKKGVPIIGVNVYLNATYDGGTTNEKGEFNFSTIEKGIQTLIVSFISYETFSKTGDITTFKNLQIKLREDVNTLDAVVINAGTLVVGDNAKVTALKPLDVVTTAGALGDFVGALQTYLEHLQFLKTVAYLFVEVMPEKHRFLSMVYVYLHHICHLQRTFLLEEGCLRFYSREFHFLQEDIQQNTDKHCQVFCL